MNYEIKSYLKKAIDLEVVGDDRLFIILKNKKVLLKNISLKGIEECYEIFSERFSSSKKNKKVFWTPDEINYLKVNYSLLEINELMKRTNKSLYQINLMLRELDIITKKNWTELELQFLEKNIDKNSSWLANKLSRSVASVKSKKRVLKLKKNKE